MLREGFEVELEIPETEAIVETPPEEYKEPPTTVVFPEPFEPVELVECKLLRSPGWLSESKRVRE